MVRTASNWLRTGTSGGLLKLGDELSRSFKCWEVPESLHNWQLLRKGSAP
jgi:hypothetical protein